MATARQIGIYPPALSLAFGWNVSQSFRGVIRPASNGYPNFWGNFVNISSDDASVSGNNFVSAQTLRHVYGGGNTRGGRNSFSVYSILSRSTALDNPNRNYVAGQFNARASAPDGGINTGAGALGAVFGLSSVGVLQNSAVNFLECSAGEFNVAMQAGSSAKYKNILSLVGRNDDVVPGSVYDCMLALSIQTGAVTWKDGVLIGTMNGSMFPVTGSLIRTMAGTFTYGMDLSASTITAPVVAPLITPVSASAPGKTGAIVWDTNFVYVCVATNTWKRAALASW